MGPQFCENCESPALRNLNHHVSADAAWPLRILRLACLFSMFGLLFSVGLVGVFFLTRCFLLFVDKDLIQVYVLVSMIMKHLAVNRSGFPLHNHLTEENTTTKVV